MTLQATTDTTGADPTGATTDSMPEAVGLETLTRPPRRRRRALRYGIGVIAIMLALGTVGGQLTAARSAADTGPQATFAEATGVNTPKPAAAETPAPSGQTDGGLVQTSGGWGFNAQLWSYTIADPWGAYRLYYYNKCNPKKGKRYLKMSSSWIYRTYECWAILA